MNAVFTLEGSMNRRPGAPVSRFVFTCQAIDLESALEYLEHFLNPEKSYKVTSVNCSTLNESE